MAKIIVNNPRQVINGGAKKYYFKVKGLGGPKGDKGDKGDTGATGPEGPQGNAATVSIGSTTTLPVGYDATVTNSGSIYNAVLNFGIPQGPRGPQGATGATGAKGDKGDQGNPGPQGEKGTNATVTVGTTTTTEPGTQAYAWNSSSNPNNAVINFNIPRGATGATGATGPQGPTGPTGPAGADGADGQDGQNFTPTIVETLPTTGDQSKLYLTPKAHTTSTATGNPIEATITAQAGQLESFQLDGDTFQQSYEGKNLLVYPYYNTTKSTSGITFTDNGDGSITIKGTLTGDEALFWITRDIWSYNTSNIVVPAGTYTISPTGDQHVYFYVSAFGETQGLLGSWNSTTSPVTFTVSEKSSLTMRISVKPQGTAIDNLVVKPQLEAGSTATSFEPFVGGQPSPNPSYPQQIQTVTGEQTVTVTGKNLLPSTLSKTKGYLDSHGVVYADDPRGEATYDFLKIEPDTTYTFTIFSTGDEIAEQYWFGIGAYSSQSENDFVSMAYRSGTGTNNYVTFTTPSGANYIRISGRYLKNATEVQLELGSTASAYAPYSKQTLPLNLGTIELCNLGTYQDYIYKDGEDWKVHKETAIASASNREWEWANISPNGWYFSHTNYGFYYINKINVISKSFIGVKRSVAPNTSGAFITIAGDGSICIRNPNITGSSNVTQFTNWLNSLNTTWLYSLTTPTDTAITDTTLIAQLEAIRTASLENGTNTITNTATGTNLAGDMEIGYFGFNPTNRYDKFIWLNLNNNYEQIGGE